METTKENGGSVDSNENEDGGDLTAGVRGGASEAGKGPVYVSGGGRNVKRDAAVQPPPLGREMKCLPGPGEFTGSCVISGVCGGLNGFTESFRHEEATEVELDLGSGGGHRLGLAGTTPASCPAALLRRLSAESDGQMRESEGDAANYDDVASLKGSTACVANTGCLRTSYPLDRQACSGKHQQSCDCKTPTFTGPNVNMANGDGDPVEVAHCKRTGVFSRPGVSDGDTGEVKVANGDLHIENADGAACDSAPREETHRPEAERESGAGSGLCLKDQSGSSARQRPATLHSSPSPSRDAPSLGSSVRHPVARTSTTPGVNGDRPLSEPSFMEDDEVFGDPSFPVRPHSLRTNPNLTVSLSCDATPLSPDGDFYFGCDGYMEDFRNILETGRRQSAPDKLPDLTDHSDNPDAKMMPKRFGIADFFTRSLFSRKPKEPKAPSHNAPGWRLFGRTASREVEPTNDSSSISSTERKCPEEEDEEQLKDSGLSLCPPVALTTAGRRKLEFEPLSTTALILEDRPANLPAKSVEETLRHKMEYEEMVAGAKRREMKDAQKKKRQMKERHRREESISNAMVIWNTEILPHWEDVKATRRVRDLWWQGLPPSVRGRVWSLAIGNELNITPELYEIFLSRAKEKWRSYSETSSVNDSESEGASLADRESSLDLIKLDISRTFPSLFIFQKGGPYHDLLHSVLGAYTCYRPDIGYVQGMSFIAAVLILNLEEADAFITFANLLNKPCQMSFFRVDHELMLKYFAAFEVFFEENLPRLFGHFQSSSLTPDLYLIDWIFTLYSKSLPLDVACRVWDVFCRDGEESLFRTALGILRLFEDILLQMDFIHIAQFLSRLPEDLQSHTLFAAMANTHMVSRNRRWAQVFSALMKDGSKETDKNASPALRS